MAKFLTYFNILKISNVSRETSVKHTSHKRAKKPPKTNQKGGASCPLPPTTPDPPPTHPRPQHKQPKQRGGNSTRRARRPTDDKAKKNDQAAQADKKPPPRPIERPRMTAVGRGAEEADATQPNSTTEPHTPAAHTRAHRAPGGRGTSSCPFTH